MENCTFQWVMHLYLCMNAMMYVFMGTHLVIYWFYIFQHSNNKCLSINVFIYLYLIRLSLDERPLEFLEHIYTYWTR